MRFTNLAEFVDSDETIGSIFKGNYWSTYTKCHFGFYPRGQSAPYKSLIQAGDEYSDFVFILIAMQGFCFCARVLRFLHITRHAACY